MTKMDHLFSDGIMDLNFYSCIEHDKLNLHIENDLIHPIPVIK